MISHEYVDTKKVHIHVVAKKQYLLCGFWNDEFFKAYCKM